MPTVLNLFPARVAIGTVQADGSVLMTQEFAKAMSALFERVGGPTGISIQDIVAIASSNAESAQALSVRSDVDALSVSGQQTAALSVLAAEVAELRALIGQAGVALALQQQLEAMRAELAMIEDPGAQVRYILTRFAPLVSPNFTGIPTAPTAAAGTNTTQIATCAFVQAKQDKITAQTVTGSRGGNAALTSLLTGLATQGLIINNTTA